MRRYSLNARRTLLALAATVVASLGVATTAAQAVVVNDGGTRYGVALLPSAGSPGTLPSGLQVPNPTGSCYDPSLAPDLTWLSTGMVSPLCYHGGGVLPGNETYVLTWDPDRSYWSTTKQYVEQFLSDVAGASGSFGSPFAVTPQYTGTNGRAGNVSLFAGGCVDYGNPTNDPSAGGYTCQFGANRASGTGYNYPLNDPNVLHNNCYVTGNNLWGPSPNGPLNTTANSVCLTDADIKLELQRMLPQMGLPGGNATKSGIQLQPLVDVLLPSGVEVCLDSAGLGGAGHVCSANSEPTTATDGHQPQAQFCSYHSQVLVGSQEVTYVVQPWTAQFGQGVGCDDPGAPNITLPADVTAIAQQVADKLVSPLSQAELGAITDPGLDGWYGYNSAENGAEINDNGCGPLGSGLDKVTLNGTTYALQREFNNGGAIVSDPNALPCTDWVELNPTFVVPGPVEPGDNVLFDGSVTASALVVHNGDYSWNFGDGTTGTGPSVYHRYANGGNYQVTLSVKDRGGNTASITQTVTVLGSNGQPVPTTPAPGGGTTSPSPSPSTPSLNVHLQLLPQSIKTVLRYGIGVRVSSNEAANGIATVWIARAAAKRAHIKVGKAQNVRIGIGTVSSITNGTVTLRLHLSRATAKKLAHLGHLTLTVRLALVAPGNQTFAVDAAGRY